MRFESETESKIHYGGDGDVFLTALNEAIAPFGGSTLGNAPDGSTDIEFPSVTRAHDFLEDAQMMDAAILRDPLRAINDRVVIIISLPLFMYRQAVAGRMPRAERETGKTVEA